jgi:hypothetical protein
MILARATKLRAAAEMRAGEKTTPKASLPPSFIFTILVILQIIS